MAYMLTAVLTALVALAGDVTGTWSGTLKPDDRDPSPALLVLRQEGGTITGTAGADASDRRPIRNGVIKDGVVTFEVEAGESVMRFDLKVNGDELTGVIVRERDGQQQKATLLVKRTK